MNHGGKRQPVERDRAASAMPPERFKPPREWPSGLLPLGLGLGLSSLLFVAALGLRWPVLLGALLPALAAGRLWRRRQRRLTAAAIASGDLLDPWILQQRLAVCLSRPPQDPEALNRWQAIGAELEGVRHLSACLIELDASATVPLLLQLEGWLDRAQQLPGAAHRGGSELVHRLASCRAHLAHLHQEALLFARFHPGEPILLPPLSTRCLP